MTLQSSPRQAQKDVSTMHCSTAQHRELNRRNVAEERVMWELSKRCSL
jgi:hypothetical protein